MRKLLLIIVLLGTLLGIGILALRERKSTAPAPVAAGELKTIYDRLIEFSEPVRLRLTPYFQREGVNYPPSRMALVAIKETRKLELWAANEYEDLRFIREYDVLAASGHLGPKLREGDTGETEDNRPRALATASRPSSARQGLGVIS